MNHDQSFAGNGGLNWDQVRPLIENVLQGIPASILIYEPDQQIRELAVIKK